MTNTYATTEELNEFMVMSDEIPNPSIKGEDRLLETVGVGDNSTAKFYVDNAFIIDGTYSFYYGVNELAALSQSFIETTDYTLDKDLGTFTLTSAGVTKATTSNIYAAYKFNRLGFKDSDLARELVRIEDWIDKKTSNHWATGTDETPNYNKFLDEKKTGQGLYKRSYFTLNRPLPDVSTTLSASTSIGSTSMTVASTDGFPSSGYVELGGEKVTYSSKSTTSFTVSALTTAHVTSENILPFVFEASNSLDGSTPTWTVLSQGTDYDLDLDTGRVYLSEQEYNVTNAQAYSNSPQHRVPNRFRMSYVQGNEEITKDINQLALMLTSKDLLHRAVRKAHVTGLNDFDPGLVSVDEDWIKQMLSSYKNKQMGS